MTPDPALPGAEAWLSLGVSASTCCSHLLGLGSQSPAGAGSSKPGSHEFTARGWKWGWEAREALLEPGLLGSRAWQGAHIPQAESLQRLWVPVADLSPTRWEGTCKSTNTEQRDLFQETYFPSTTEGNGYSVLLAPPERRN